MSIFAFANEQREFAVPAARCSWCNNTPLEVGKRELFDVRATFGDFVEKGRVCSSECSVAWRAWAHERIERINKAFPF